MPFQESKLNFTSTMTIAAKLLQAMRYDQPYTVRTLADMCRTDVDTTAYLLDQFFKNGLVERLDNNKYKRNRSYKSKQRELPYDG